MSCEIYVPLILELYPRSSIGINYGMTLVNTVGIVDMDYSNAANEGHIIIAINVTKTYTIKKGERIAQGIFKPFYITEDDNVTTERNGGFGSTGK